MPRLATPASRISPPRHRDTATIAVLAVAGLLLLVPLSRLLSTPSTITSLRIENDLTWTVNVDVAESPSGARLGLGAVPRGHGVTFETIVDQGDRWFVVFEYAGVEVVTPFNRRQLDAAGWKVTVPSQLRDRLTDAGVAPTPVLDSGGSPET